jgi:GT2 family glycosyltransferase
LFTRPRSAASSAGALTDDDAWVSESWVQDIIDHFAANPDVHCIGGRVCRAQPDLAELAIRESMEPESIRLAEFSAFSIQLIGCNMSVRRSLLQEIGLFDPNLGPGAPTKAGEDLDFLYRIVAHGHSLNYVPQVLVHHNHGRRSAAQIHAVRQGYLRGRGAFYAKQILQRDARASSWAYWEVAANLKRCLKIAAAAEGAPPAQVLRELARGAWAYVANKRVAVPKLSAA